MLNRFGLLLYTKFFGNLVGKDAFNNKYYCSKNLNNEKHWVIYNGVNDPSKIEAGWFAWLHFMNDAVPAKKNATWAPNLTGTKFARKTITSIENIPQTTLSYYESWSPHK